MTPNFFQAATRKKIWVEATVQKSQVATYKNLGRFYRVPFKSLLRVQIKRTMSKDSNATSYMFFSHFEILPDHMGGKWTPFSHFGAPLKSRLQKRSKGKATHISCSGISTLQFTLLSVEFTYLLPTYLRMYLQGVRWNPGQLFSRTLKKGFKIYWSGDAHFGIQTMLSGEGM